ncbi:MAG: hypothetical protein ACD_71C00042G0001 [uncultured bacterium (gcode 4)]|uniref:Uncharacterized protein n=1 Tax=uncultured bacterium (gcode 4) TaxID=1234023 RepID=K1ZJW6_9BACT|nr:MAG: hypothetical protein ACD_71C00042G0001 [uncultured bacterium (gcode 4)]
MFPELYNRIENEGPRESRVSEEKRSFLIVEEFSIVENREGELNRASWKLRQIFPSYHPTESAIRIGHLDVELFRDCISESIGSNLWEALSTRCDNKVSSLYNLPRCLMDEENIIRFFYFDDIAFCSNLCIIFRRFAHKKVEKIFGFSTF